MNRRKVVTCGRRGASADDGAIGLFGIGLTFCVCLLIGGGVAVGSTQIARVDVLDAADHASASAADRLALDSTYGQGVETAALDSEQARTEAVRVLAATPRPAHVASWRVGDVHVEGQQVVVTVQAVVDPPVIGSALSALGAPIDVTITSRADAHLQR